MKVINNNNSCSILIIAHIYNKYKKDRKEINQFNILNEIKNKNITKEYLKEYGEKILNDLIGFSIAEKGNRVNMFNYIQMDEKYSVNYYINHFFIEMCEKLNNTSISTDIMGLNNPNLIQFYLEIIENQEGFFTIEKLKKIFNAEFKYSLDRDFINLIVKPAIKEINKKTNIEIIYFKKISKKNIYRFIKK